MTDLILIGICLLGLLSFLGYGIAERKRREDGFEYRGCTVTRFNDSWVIAFPSFLSVYADSRESAIKLIDLYVEDQ